MNNFWRGDSLAARWFIGVGVPLTLGLITVVSTGFVEIKNNAQKGRDAYDKMVIIEPKLDSLLNKFDGIVSDMKQQYERQTYRDSIRNIETIKGWENMFEKYRELIKE